ncbi:MAG: N-acetylmuramoyl-L-alanine amidase [Pseudomonadota bacterium]
MVPRGSAVAALGRAVSVAAALAWAAATGPAAAVDEAPRPRLTAVEAPAAETLVLRFADRQRPAVAARRDGSQTVLAIPFALADEGLALPQGVALRQAGEGTADAALTLTLATPVGARWSLSARGPGRLALALTAVAPVRRGAASRAPQYAPLPRARGASGALAVPGQGAADTDPWALDPQAAAAPPERDTFLVIVDPGHGGHDPGASVDGMVEKRLTLAFAHRLKRRIDATAGLSAVLTRVDDRYLPLGERARRAIAAGGAAFVSIHADVVLVGQASGVAVYTLTPEAHTQTADEMTGETPRDRILRGTDLSGQGDDVTRVLVDLAQRRSVGAADRLATTLVEAIGAVTPLLHSRPHRRGNFRVLRNADLPAVLVELGFLTSEQDRARFSDVRWQERMAGAMAAALDRWRQTIATDRAQ